ncbi:glycosyl transferase [Leptospira santarosai]|uniref:glycosyl transferase n=1 Tax=Leptospira santarosai TaxID=28183 RepID=UPI0026E141C6|nr:glycosyl transferase [Leptospira santarosai]MDO6382094.1 glycosyl transferase [Leptospira santarosai]
MKYLCTLFDFNYLPLGLSLYESVRRHFGDFHLWVLAMDDKAYDFFKENSFDHVTVLSLNDIESGDVLTAKGNRTWQEYCWTLSPVLPTYVLRENPDIDHITYLDSDIYFFSDVGPVYDEIGRHSIMIIPHRFPDRLKDLEANGIYNVQMVYFKRDEIGMKCLSRWREQCLEWCYNRAEDGRLGDQKYLDVWPQTYKNVCVLKNEQAGVALWNAERYKIRSKDEEILIDERPLIFYHFHMFKFYEGNVYGTGIFDYKLKYEVLRPIYDVYVKQLIGVVSRFDLKLIKLNILEICIMMEKGNFYAYSVLKKMFWNVLLYGLIVLKKILRIGRVFLLGKK